MILIRIREEEGSFPLFGFEEYLSLLVINEDIDEFKNESTI